MKKLFVTITVITVIAASSAFAGGDHFHPKQIVKCGGPCSETQIKGAVPEAIPYLNKWGKIDTAWTKATIESVSQKQFKKGPEWVVTLADASKQKRYLFFTLDGFVTGSNATGE